jgi:hypothetical protein
MAIREVVLERIPAKDSVIYINKSGISFSAAFVRKNNLTEMEGVKFFVDDEDSHFLGFEFVKDTLQKNTLSLMASGRSKGGSAGFTVKAQELMNSNQILATIANFEKKEDRTFEVSFDKKRKIFYVRLKPCFELSIAWEVKNAIPAATKGIYRYLNKDGQVIYIGKGDIRARADSPERKEWQIRKIEYSIIEDDDSSYFWEEHYISRHVSAYGTKPLYNLVLGHSVEK